MKNIRTVRDRLLNPPSRDSKGLKIEKQELFFVFFGNIKKKNRGLQIWTISRTRNANEMFDYLQHSHPDAI